MIRHSIQSKCPGPPYYLGRVLIILVEDSAESVPNGICNFPHVIGKRSLNKSVLLSQQGAFFLLLSQN